MRLRSPHIVLVCLLAFTTLWLSETAASHVHLDNDNLSCDICHSANGNDAALQSRPASLNLLTVTTGSQFAILSTPVSRTVAPLNSRAPPSLI